MPKLLLIFLLAAFAAQSQSIRGVVVDEKGDAVASATVLVLQARDSSTQKIDVTNAKGLFEVSNLRTGTYLLCVTHVGYSKTFSSPLTIPVPGNITLVLKEQSSSLKTATVVARKPLIEVSAGKMIINVENTLNNIGTTALDVLRKSPGVTVDNEDNLSLAGKNGVQVYIDGRQSPLTGSDLSGYLASLQSSQIESIEIMTNPSAKYEAAGNAGIINIRLKKNKAFGTNGSLTAGYGNSVFPKYNAGFSLNHRNRLVNIFATYAYSASDNLINTWNYRISADSIFYQDASRTLTDKPHNIQAGIDFFIDKNSTLGIIVNATPYTQLSHNTSITTIQQKDSNATQMLLDAGSDIDIERQNTSANLNYRFATAKKEFNVDLDYVDYHIVNDQFQPNTYYDRNKNFLFSRVYHMLTTGDIQMHSIKANYDFDLLKGKLSVGGKYGSVNSENDLQRSDVISSVKKFDSLNSNQFTYKEKIAAVFARYTKDYKKFLLQVGIRVENTTVEGYSRGYRWAGSMTRYDSAFTRKYTDPFPSASLTYKRNASNQYSISIGRRIDRPQYASLNPFEYRIDEYVYRKGNSNLRPQYTTVIELLHVFKNRLTTTISYSQVEDFIVSIFDTIEVSRTYLAPVNLATQKLLGLSINYIFQGKRVNGFINLNPFYSSVESNFGKERQIDLDAFSVIAKSQVGYRFNKGLSVELAAIYNSPFIGFGSFEFKNDASIDFAIGKTMFDNRLNVKASITDIFFTTRTEGISNFAGQYIDIKRTREPRLVRLNVSYKFGSSTVKAARQRRTLMEEENRRMQSSN